MEAASISFQESYALSFITSRATTTIFKGFLDEFMIPRGICDIQNQYKVGYYCEVANKNVL